MINYQRKHKETEYIEINIKVLIWFNQIQNDFLRVLHDSIRPCRSFETHKNLPIVFTKSFGILFNDLNQSFFIMLQQIQKFNHFNQNIRLRRSRLNIFYNFNLQQLSLQNFDVFNKSSQSLLRHAQVFDFSQSSNQHFCYNFYRILSHKTKLFGRKDRLDC